MSLEEIELRIEKRNKSTKRNNTFNLLYVQSNNVHLCITITWSERMYK